jgi:large subunit ribosomal protein L17
MSLTNRKFGRERDQRKALVRSVAVALIEHGSIETTLPKAKSVVPFVEKLITTAKRGGLHARRQVIARLNSEVFAAKLIDELSPRLSSRSSGYLRVKPTQNRRGDNALMARVSFVDDLTTPVPAKAKAPTVKPKVTRTKSTPKKAAKATT